MMKKLLYSLILLGFSVASHAATVSLAWDASPSSNVNSYRVYKAPGTNAVFAGNAQATVAVTVNSPTLTASVGGLPDGAWSFAVTSVDTVNNLESVFSNVVWTNVVNLPIAPTSLVVSAVSSSQLRLNWVDNSTNEDGFKIERSTDGVNFVQLVTTGAGVVSYTDAGLVANSLYYYRVRSYNVAGNSGYTAVASARTTGSPNPPTNVRITSSTP